MRVMTFVPRFVPPTALGELSQLWHTSRVACQPVANRYTRMLWTSNTYHTFHPEVSSTAVYKDLDAMLDFGGR